MTISMEPVSPALGAPKKVTTLIAFPTLFGLTS